MSPKDTCQRRDLCRFLLQSEEIEKTKSKGAANETEFVWTSNQTEELALTAGQRLLGVMVDQGYA